jgi:hypothetical protein
MDKEIFFTYNDISGNLFINPKSNIKDQIFELINNCYIEKGESPLKYFDLSKLTINN